MNADQTFIIIVSVVVAATPLYIGITEIINHYRKKS